MQSFADDVVADGATADATGVADFTDADATDAGRVLLLRKMNTSKYIIVISITSSTYVYQQQRYHLHQQ